MKKLAVFASGTGTNFEAIAKACAEGVIDARVEVMVCDVPGAAVIAKAERYGVPTFVFAPKSYSGGKAAYEKEIVELLDSKGIDLVCLAGYMRIVGDVLLGAYVGRIINIHPSLLPAFRGAHAVERLQPGAAPRRGRRGRIRDPGREGRAAAREGDAADEGPEPGEPPPQYEKRFSCLSK